MSFKSCKIAGCSVAIKSDDPIGLCHGCLKQAALEQFKPRGWQGEANVVVNVSKDPFNLISACPGAGKTAFAGYTVSKWTTGKESIVGRDKWKIVIVVPTEHLKVQWSSELYAMFGLNMNTRMNSATGLVGSIYDGYILTYQQLPLVVDKFEQWHNKGVRFITCADELHHCGNKQVWGDALERLGNISLKILGLSGTPWRSDKCKIPFVKLDGENSTICDFTYSYRQAIREEVCRPIAFRRIDSYVNVDEITTGEEFSSWWRDATLENTGKPESWWLGKGLDESRETIGHMVACAVEALAEVRARGPEYRDAAGCIHCMSKRSGYLKGEDDIEAEDDPRFMHHVHNLVTRRGYHSTKVGAHIDNSSGIIKAFSAEGGGDFLCSIRKVSEGIDIRRLMVGLYVTNITTLLNFIQTAGRYTRWNKALPKDQEGVLIIPKTPSIERFAAQIEMEVREGVAMRDKESTVKPKPGGDPSNPSKIYNVKEATPYEAGSIYRGDDWHQNNSHFIDAGKLITLGLGSGLSQEKLATILRDYNGMAKTGGAPTPSAPIMLPLTEEERCDAVISEIKKLISAVTKRVPGFEEYNRVHHHLNVMQGVPRGVKNGQQWVRENFGVDGLEKRLEILKGLLKNQAGKGA